MEAGAITGITGIMAITGITGTMVIAGIMGTIPGTGTMITGTTLSVATQTPQIQIMVTG
jgi:hypothetical protein